MIDSWPYNMMTDPFSLSSRMRKAVLTPRRLAGRFRRRVRGFRRAAAASCADVSMRGPRLDYAEDGDRGQMNRRALLSFVAWPFHASPDEVSRVHMCLQHSVEIARAFNRLGYVVDVIDLTDEEFVPSRRYDVLFGMHSNFARLAPMFSDVPRIYYATGPYWKSLRQTEGDRKREIDKRFGIDAWIPSRIKEDGFLDMANSVLSLGNAFVADKYKIENPNVQRIDNSAIVTRIPMDIGDKDFGQARKNFLWLGSVDMIRKGLPLLLDVFSRVPDAHLWVCGSFDTPHDRPLIRAYRHALFHTPNIHPLGWMDLHSERFARICQLCAWTILPSCGEGMAGAILDCMARGVVPVVSVEVGVDTDRCGATFPDMSEDSIIAVIRSMAEMPENRCREQAAAAMELAGTRYTLDAYRRNIEQRLIAMLASKSESCPSNEVVHA